MNHKETANFIIRKIQKEGTELRLVLSDEELATKSRLAMIDVHEIKNELETRQEVSNICAVIDNGVVIGFDITLYE